MPRERQLFLGASRTLLLLLLWLWLPSLPPTTRGPQLQDPQSLARLPLCMTRPQVVPSHLASPGGSPRQPWLGYYCWTISRMDPGSGLLAPCAPGPRLPATCPCLWFPEPGLTAAPAPPFCHPLPARARPDCAAQAPTFGACPLPLAAAARGTPGQQHPSPCTLQGGLSQCVSAQLKKMGMDGLTEQKMPGDIPEPRMPNPGLLRGGRTGRQGWRQSSRRAGLRGPQE